VAPILKDLIFNRGPATVMAWAGQVATWQFEQIIPAHLAAPVTATPKDFLAAFAFLQPQPNPAHHCDLDPIRSADSQLLRDIDQLLVKGGIAQPRVTE
jgi:hypothetical protein